MKRKAFLWAATAAFLLTPLSGNLLSARADDSALETIQEANMLDLSEESADNIEYFEAAEPIEDAEASFFEETWDEELTDEEFADEEFANEAYAEEEYANEEYPDEDTLQPDIPVIPNITEEVLEDGTLLAGDIGDGPLIEDSSEEVIITWHKNYNGSEESYSVNTGSGTTIWGTYSLPDRWDDDEDVSSVIVDGFYVGGPSGELVTDFSEGYNVKKSVDLYLHWTQAVLVTWDLQGGYYVKEGGIQHSENITTKGLPGGYLDEPVDGHPEYPDETKGFLGWSTTPGGKLFNIWDEKVPQGTTALKLYAVYEDYITITFNGGDGAQQIIGWDGNDQPIYEENSIHKETILKGDELQLDSNIFHKNGYLVTKWVAADNQSEEYSIDIWQPFDRSLTLNAVWSKTYTLTFYPNGEDATIVYGEGAEGAMAWEGNPLTAKVALGQTYYPYWGKRSGYAFAGWSLSPTGEVIVLPGDGFKMDQEMDLAFYAIWGEPVTVRLHSNGGWFFDSSDHYLYTKKAAKGSKLSINSLRRPSKDGQGYLKGWATDADGENIVLLYEEYDPEGNYQTFTVDKEMDLYAVWTGSPEPPAHVARQEATCVQDGHIEYWEYQGQKYADESLSKKLSDADIVIPKTGIHTWDAGIINRRPTEDMKGIRFFKCKICGQKRTEDIPPLTVNITITKKPSKFKATADTKGRVTLTWARLTNSSKKAKAQNKKIKKIQIQCSTNASFTNIQITKVLSKTKSKFVLSKLKAKTKYYFRIRYMDGRGGYSNWVTKSVKTKKK